MGYTRRDRMMNGMWSKSSRQYARRFESNLIKLGLGLGASLLGKGNSSSYSRLGGLFPIETVPFKDDPFKKSAKSAKVECIILLVLALVFQVLGPISYCFWDFWTFFSLLIFSTLAFFCIGFSFTIADESIELGEIGQRDLFNATIIVVIVLLCLSFWPVLFKDTERTSLSYILLITEDVLLIIVTISLCYESSVAIFGRDNKKSLQNSAAPKLSAKSKQSSSKANKYQQKKYDN